MTLDRGCFLLARKLISRESWLMSKPPLWLKLWVWMLGQANFKDREKLKRGQFVTSIAEMQEAMSYRVGFRKITPTRDEIRSAYEGFSGRHETSHEDQMKPPMITTTKTTRGMIITICNYGKYQDFKSYEAHSEPLDEDTTKPPATPHDTERMNRTKRTKVKNTSSDALRLSGLLADLIAANNPSNRSVQTTTRDRSVQNWAEDIDRMLRLDSRSPDEAEAVIEWCQADSFWSGNILSGSSLRKQFDKLTLQMQRGTQKGRSPGEVVPITRRIY